MRKPRKTSAGALFPDLSLGQAERPAVRRRFPLTLKGEPGGSPEPTLKMKGNFMRKRNKTITIRVTEDEWCAIMKQVLKAGMNVTDYLVTAATNTQIYVAEDTKPLIAELKRIGNNLNQITAKINAGAFHSYNFYEVIEMQRAIYEEVRRIGRGE